MTASFRIKNVTNLNITSFFESMTKILRLYFELYHRWWIKTASFSYLWWP